MFAANGFDDFLSKPINISELNAVLEKWIPKEKQGEPEQRDIPRANGGLTIEGLDTAKGIFMTGGTVSQYLDILSVFRSEAARNINELKKHAESGDAAMYATIAHALKSSAASIGSIRLPKIAEALETAGLKGDTAYIRDNNGGFLRELEALLDNIHKAVPAKGVNPGTMDGRTLAAELLKLKTAMEDYDTSEINNIAAALQEFENEGSAGEIIRKILQYKLIGEFDEAAAYINEIMPDIS
jgi:HPt (histidine-containing phosphotransfer) domain-containing protein